MAIKVSEVVEAARYETARWESLRQPFGTVMRALNDLQGTLFNEAARYDPNFMAQSIGIVVKNVSFAGYPAQVSDAGAISVDDSPAGDLVELVSEIEYDNGVATSATSTTLADTSKAWTTDEHVNRYIHITFGTGKGQKRRIVSNTGTVLTIDSAYPWTTTPDTTSLYEIVSVDVEAQDDLKVTIGIEPTTSQVGFAVKLNPTTGQPYVAPNEPLEVKSRYGVPLPDLVRVIDLTIYRATYGQLEAAVIPYEQRYDPNRRPAVYILNNRLYLIEPGTDWCENDEIELRYVPVAPQLTATTDYLLLPENARTACKWAACQALEARYPTDQAARWDAYAAAARAEFLNSLTTNRRKRRVKEVW